MRILKHGAIKLLFIRMEEKHGREKGHIKKHLGFHPIFRPLAWGICRFFWKKHEAFINNMIMKEPVLRK